MQTDMIHNAYAYKVGIYHTTKEIKYKFIDIQNYNLYDPNQIKGYG